MWRYTLAALAILAGPAATDAQLSMDVPDYVHEWAREIEQINAKIRSVQQRALQDRAVAAEHERTTQLLRGAIAAVEPGVLAMIDRFNDILAEARAARQAGGQQTVAALAKEAEVIQPRIQAAHARALGVDEVAHAVADFQRTVRAKMVELDPSVRPLIERIRTLEARISAEVTELPARWVAVTRS